jgi:hypothetical protein
LVVAAKNDTGGIEQDERHYSHFLRHATGAVAAPQHFLWPDDDDRARADPAAPR